MTVLTRLGKIFSAFARISWHIGVCFGLVVFAVACRNDSYNKSTEQLFADFSVRYLEGEKQIRALASFMQGDSLPTARNFAPQGGVSFQGLPMEQREFPKGGVRYTYKGTANYAPNFLFTFKDAKGNIQQQGLTMSPIRNFSVRGIASRAKGITLELDAEPIADDESLLLLFTDEQNRSASILLPGPFPTGSILVPKSYLQGVFPGKNQFYIVRRRTLPNRRIGLDVKSNVEFYSKTISVDIVD
ncbi:MAG TPA: hypothetical protein PKD70_14750 [Saprospiraceae bacterium]|nr:hypothetical protein [Saprospiraceae bacterium]HMP15135.1 hypothetical protein [Saprospiraceae bacterium]